MSLLGIDIGTSGCKAVAFDGAGRALASAYREYDILRKEPGQAELRSSEVWRLIQEVLAECASNTVNDPIEALSATSMGEALVPVDAAGEICGNSLLGMDTRGETFVQELKESLGEREIYALTGNLPGMGFSLPNLAWLKQNRSNEYGKTAKFLPWADFVCYKLSGKAYANLSLANRTLLLDLKKGAWSQRLADAAHLDLEKLPELAPAGCNLGRILPHVAAELKLPKTVEIVLGTHDQCAATLGSGACGERTAMLGLGTFACAVIVHRDADMNSQFRKLNLNIENHATADEFVSFVYHGSGGSLVKWLRDQLFRDLKGPDAYNRMFAELEPSEASPCVLPYFAGSGPLDYAAGGQGAITGLSLASTRADILRGALEGIVFYFKDAFDRIGTVERLHVTGGGANSPVWLQMTADILQVPTVKSACVECGALGSALIAGVGSGRFNSYEEAISRMVATSAVYEPKSPERYGDSFSRYQALVKRLLAKA